MAPGGLKVASVRGIDIRVDVSWLVIVLLVTWSYWERFDARAAHAGGEAFAMAVAGALLFFGSVLAHELAHALEAQHRGVHVGGITLFLFGGVTETKFDVRRPVDEFALTAVGPFTSFVLAAAFGLVAYGADEAGLAAVAAVAGLVGWINLALGVFNLLPGAPLDGGRILRAVVWWATRDRDRAIRVAARAGQALGMLILALGVSQLFFVPAAFTGGLWFAFIGWFLYRAASAELAETELRRALAGVTAADLVERRPGVAPDDPVSVAVDRFRADEADLLVVEHAGAPVGVVAVDDVRAVEPGRWDHTTVADAMRPVDGLPDVDASAPATTAIERLGDAGLVVATESGRPVGVITPTRVATVLRRAQQFGIAAGRAQPA